MYFVSLFHYSMIVLSNERSVRLFGDCACCFEVFRGFLLLFSLFQCPSLLLIFDITLEHIQMYIVPSIAYYDSLTSRCIFQKYKPEIEADHFVHYGAYSSVDVEAVDMEKFPKLRDLPWYMANMTKGDCLFIPYQFVSIKTFHIIFSFLYILKFQNY